MLSKYYDYIVSNILNLDLVSIMLSEVEYLVRNAKKMFLYKITTSRLGFFISMNLRVYGVFAAIACTALCVKIV